MTKQRKINRREQRKRIRRMKRAEFLILANAFIQPQPKQQELRR